MSKEVLQVGAIRDDSLYRANSARRDNADAEYRAVRPAAMQAGRYTCVFCSWVSRGNNECHHRDGNHANNTQENFAVVDTLCHAYHHLGQAEVQNRFVAEKLGTKTILAAIPEVPAADLNLLQKAVGVALLQEGEVEMAKSIMRALAERAEPVRDALGSHRPGDIATAMLRLTDQEYENRGAVTGPLRLIFSQDVLEGEGRKFGEDFPGLPFETWKSVFKNAD
jgi:intracellular multiplication protein IcmJ